MPTLFAALEDKLSDAVDGMFGETWTLLPHRQPTPNSRREPDPSRPHQTFQAVLDDKSAGSSSFARLGATSGGVASSGGKPQFTATNPMLFFEERRLPLGLPQRLDRVRRHDTGDIYEIIDLTKDGQGRWKCPMIKVAKD